MFRKADDKMVAGVCSGIAESLHCDPSSVRFITFLMFIIQPLGMTGLYILVWMCTEER